MAKSVCPLSISAVDLYFHLCRALEDRKRQMEENEEERRQAVLKERRREQDRAMASFRQTAHPRVKAVGAALVRRQDSSRVQCGKDIPTTLDAKEIADMVSGKVQVSVPSLDEMLGQLRDNTPVPSHEPLSVCRARETHAAAGSGAEGGFPLIPYGGTPEVQLDTNTGPESPGNIYTRMNYASLAQDSLEEEGDVRQPSPHALSSQWAEKVCPWDSLEESSSGLHLAEPVLGISRELERVASSRPSTHSEADLLARLSSATNPKLPPNNGIRQPTSILKKSGQKAMLKQILSNATETSSPPANADCKHVRFADDPSSVWEADSEIDDLEASFRAKASSGSSPHFLFSHGSEFAFRPLRNGLVPIPAGEKPLHGPSHQSDSVARLTAAPASSSQCASSSTTMDHPATAPSLPQSSLTKTHTGGSNRKERQDEGALNQTPTDDQISKLWSQMRGYMAENKALQATQRAGLQRLKQSTQRGWQHRQGWRAMVQTEQPASRRNAPEMLRGVGDSPSRGPLPGASLTAQEWRGSWRGSGQVHPAASEVERVRCSPQAACSQQEPADCSVPRGKSECVYM